jgi:hypothetical protein
MGRVAILAREDIAGLINEPLANSHLLHSVSKLLLPPVSERLVHLLDLLVLLLGVSIALWEVSVLLGDALDLELFILLEVLHAELINRVCEQKHLHICGLVSLQQWALLDALF